MNVLVKDNGYVSHAELLMKKLSERLPISNSSGGMAISLCVEDKIGMAESYRISGCGREWLVTGSDELGLYFGIGKFLHSAQWTETDFVPVATQTAVSPQGGFRALYLANHFSNFYENAPLEVVEAYIDDMLLWGYNTLVGIIPCATSNEGEQSIFDNVQKIKRFFKYGKSRKMKLGIIMSVNQGFKDAPHELDAEPVVNLWFDGNMGRNLCLSKPGTLDYMKKIWKCSMEEYTDVGLDYIITCPYDEGGCGCEKCYPWGANKYLDGNIALREEALKYFPNIKFIISTWMFDCVNNIGEFEGLYRRLKSDIAWADYIMVDNHGDFPKYPLEHELIKPIINFPEISMYGLYPWGGFGANPLPHRFQKIWDGIKHIVSSGMPYSEGLYEDISKIQCVGYYWDSDRNWRDILSEYVNYEFGADVCENALEMMCCIEENHVRIDNCIEPDMEIAKRSKELSEKIDKCITERAKTAWRWRILYIRAQLDYMRYTAYFEKTGRTEDDLKWMHDFSGDLLIDNLQAQEFFKELWGYFYSEKCNGYNMYTLPPLGGTVSQTECILFQNKQSE